MNSSSGDPAAELVGKNVRCRPAGLAFTMSWRAGGGTQRRLFTAGSSQGGSRGYGRGRAAADGVPACRSRSEQHAPAVGVAKIDSGVRRQAAAAAQPHNDCSQAGARKRDGCSHRLTAITNSREYSRGAGAAYCRIAIRRRPAGQLHADNPVSMAADGPAAARQGDRTQAPTAQSEGMPATLSQPER